VYGPLGRRSRRGPNALSIAFRRRVCASIQAARENQGIGSRRRRPLGLPSVVHVSYVEESGQFFGTFDVRARASTGAASSGILLSHYGIRTQYPLAFAFLLKTRLRHAWLRPGFVFIAAAATAARTDNTLPWGAAPTDKLARVQQGWLNSDVAAASQRRSSPSRLTLPRSPPPCPSTQPVRPLGRSVTKSHLSILGPEPAHRPDGGALSTLPPTAATP